MAINSKSTQLRLKMVTSSNYTDCTKRRLKDSQSSLCSTDSCPALKPTFWMAINPLLTSLPARATMSGLVITEVINMLASMWDSTLKNRKTKRNSLTTVFMNLPSMTCLPISTSFSRRPCKTGSLTSATHREQLKCLQRLLITLITWQKRSTYSWHWRQLPTMAALTISSWKPFLSHFLSFERCCTPSTCMSSLVPLGSKISIKLSCATGSLKCA